jgi:membrane-bound ClpP family serine protease
MNKTTYDKVYSLLTTHAELRNSDNKLLAKIWEQEMKIGTNPSFNSFLIDFKAGYLSSFESVSRARRKVQEKNVHLRGSNYGHRQKKAVKVAQTIGRIHI